MADSGYVVGYDLDNQIAQLSYCRGEDEAPVSLPAGAEEEKYAIPALLCKKHGVNQWYYGDEAIKAAEEGEGVLVRDIFHGALNEASIFIEDQEYPALELLKLFFQKTLNRLFLMTEQELPEAFQITVRQLNKRTKEVLHSMAEGLKLEEGLLRCQSYQESLYAYVLNQQEELWKNDVLLLDAKEGRLISDRLVLNRRTQPVVAFVEEEEHGEMPFPPDGVWDDERKRDADAALSGILMEVLAGAPISSVYLIGDCFEGGWMRESLKILCRGRRVFQGKNLYTKGACYSALKLKESPREPSEYVFLGKDKLKANVGMRVDFQGKEIYYPLADGGANWYDVEKECEFILEEENLISIIITPLNGRNVRNADVILRGLPVRKKRPARIRMRLTFSSEKQMELHFMDLGFGELFPSGGQVWREEILL